MRIQIRWEGKPPAGLRERIEQASKALRGPPAPGSPQLKIVALRFTRDGLHPPSAVKGDATWLWLPRGRPGLAAAREAIANGAYDVIDVSSGAALEALRARLAELAAEITPHPPVPWIVTDSEAGKAMLQRLAQAARTSMPVMITGETGTGKEEAAALIHRWSARADQPYLPINCAAIPNELMESELFGHTRGAFSGAVASMDGRLLAAAGGTVFLDEIHDTPLSTQAKLLRVLEDGEVTRLGETKGRKADFRIVTATNRDLPALVNQGGFGRDLYERLAIVRIELAPLRERRADIAGLVEHFIAAYFERERRPRTVHGIASFALEALMAHDWPGNVRELRNVVFSSLVNKHAGDTLLLSDLPPLQALPVRGLELYSRPALQAAIRGGRFDLKRELEALQRAALILALQEAGDSPTHAARLLGTIGHGRSRDAAGTLRAMMRRLRIASR